MIFDKFKPTYFENTIDKIDFNNYKKYKLLVFDIDNTLVLHDEKATDECKKLIERLKNDGFKIAILSNNTFERVGSFANDLNIDNYIFLAKKPDRKKFEELIYECQCKKDEVLMVGDQLFTDINCANNCKVDSILVKAKGPEIIFHIKVKRFLERIVLLFIRK